MMDATERDKERRRLKKRLDSGAISQGAYDGLLAALERGEAAAGEPRSVGSNPTRAGGDTSTNQPSLGAFKTVAQGLSAGTEIGTFRIHEAIGEGGMGMVWKAYDVQGERFVALKLLPPALAASAEEVARVKDVFQRVHALNHQFICPVYLFGTDARFGPYLVMKYIDGSTLSAYRRYYARKKRTFPLSEVVRTLKPVAEALDYAHSQKVVHRDIKPQNILVTRDGKDIQVVDFGLAAEIRSSMTRVSRVRMDTSGTYPYMAPEQWRGQYQDGKTDQYQLAVVAYELLAGRLPFEAPDSDVLRLCVLQEPVAEIAGQPGFVNMILSKALAKDRGKRYADCRAFIQALDQDAAVPAVLAAPATPPAPVVELVPVLEVVPLVPIPAAEPADREPSRRSSEARPPSRREPPRLPPVRDAVPAESAWVERAEPRRSEPRYERPPRPPARKSSACAVLLVLAGVLVAVPFLLCGGLAWIGSRMDSNSTQPTSVVATSRIVGKWRSTHMDFQWEVTRDVFLKADGSYVTEHTENGQKNQADSGTYTYEERNGVYTLTLYSSAGFTHQAQIQWLYGDQISGTLQEPHDPFYGDPTFIWDRVP